MLNEDVVKNINKLNNEQDNINLELSKKASKEDLDKLIQGGTNVAISKYISTNDWTLEEGVYITIVEHNLVTRKVLVSLVDKTTNNNVFCSYQILDDNSIKIFNESNNELECIVVNGNSAIKMVSATIDDNRSTGTTTYSSVKIEALFKVLENKIDDIENFKEVDNIKCTTDTGAYTIENSQKGYLTNFNIEGKTLVNLASTNMFILEGNSIKEGDYIKLNNSASYVNLTNRLSAGIYTLIINVTNINESYTVHTILNGGGNEGVYTRSGKQILHIGMSEDVNKLRVYTENSSNTLGIQMVLLEGIYTSGIKYFDGLQSVGQGNNIELLSYQGENLFDGTYQDGYFDGNSLDEELIQGMPCITTNWIECNPNVEYYFLGGNRKQIQFKNENNIFKSVILNSNNFETPTNCTHFRLYYARTDQFYSLLNIYKKGDIKIIPHELRSLSSEIKDRIIYKNNGYKLVQKCEEITLNGNETWGIHTSVEKTNTMVFATSKGIINSNGDTCILNSDKFKPVSANILANCDYECIANGGNTGYETMIRIAKTKVDSLETFKTWLKSNNITVLYPLERPQVQSLVDLSMQTFEGKTKFLLFTRSIIPTINFEVTQNFGSNIEILKSKINTLESMSTYSKTIDLSDKLLNGWKKAYDIHQGLILSKIGNVVQISSVIKDGLFTAGTIIVCLPKEFTPSKITPIQIFDNGESLGSLEIRPEGYIKIAIVNKNSTRIIFNGSYILD
ncbi:hypothetical protein ACTPEO_05405 [Clostridioides difficile]